MSYDEYKDLRTFFREAWKDEEYKFLNIDRSLMKKE